MTEVSMQHLIDSLPQREPFRFVDHIHKYEQGELLQASFYPEPIKTHFGNQECLPSAILIEGLAQTAILFVQLETTPLRSHEIPLLGKVDVSLEGQAVWNEELIYVIRPLRMTASHALLSGHLLNADKHILVDALLSVAISGRRTGDGHDC